MTKVERKALQKETGIVRNNDGTVYVDPTVYVDKYTHERLDDAQEAAVREMASEYQPDYIKSADTSLICLLVNQRDNIHTFSAVQAMTNHVWPNPQELRALHAVAAADVPEDIIDTMIWMWCNGRNVPENVTMQMVNFEQHIEHCLHRLDLTIKSAEGLPNVDKLGKTDAYVKVFFDDGANGEKEVGETDPIQDSLNPVWDLPFPALSTEGPEHVGWCGKIRLIVMDHEKVGKDREIGEASLQITGKRMPYPLSKMLGEQTLVLKNKITAGKGSNKPGGNITIQLAEHHLADDIEQEISGKEMDPAEELREAKKAARRKRKEAKEAAIKAAKDAKKDARKARRRAKLEKQQAKMKSKMNKLDGIEDDIQDDIEDGNGAGSEAAAEDDLDLKDRVKGGWTYDAIHSRNDHNWTTSSSSEEEEGKGDEEDREQELGGCICKRNEDTFSATLSPLDLQTRVQGGGGGKKKSSKKAVGIADSTEVVLEMEDGLTDDAEKSAVQPTVMADGPAAETLEEAEAMQAATLAAASSSINSKKVQPTNPMLRALEEVEALKAAGALDTSQVRGKLVISVIRAMNLIKADRLGKSDPFVAVRVEGHQRNTPVIKNDQDPVWEVSFTFKIFDRTRSVVECYLHDMDGKTKGDPLGQVTFPLHSQVTGGDLLTPGVPLTQIFHVEPIRGMHQQVGELGDLELRMLFVPTTIPHVEDLPLDSPPLANVLSYANERHVAYDLVEVLREAMVILAARSVAELKNPQHTTDRSDYETLHGESEAELEQDPMIDRNYDLDEDLETEGIRHRPPRQKHATAVAYGLAKFFEVNPAVFNIIEHSTLKFQASPTIKGSFAAAVLGVLGMPEIALGGIRSFLRDRLKEEMIRLINAAKMKRRWYSALQDISRGRGCASTCVDHASEIVAFADSFATASALQRLKAGKGAAEVNENCEIESVVSSEKNRVVSAAFQNLQRMIWPAKEESLDALRKMVEGNREAESALWGWEARAELKMILSGDEVALRALYGLVAMEELKYRLELKDKELELIGLKRLLAGDKGAMDLARSMTPDMFEKLSDYWKSQTLFGKVRLVFFAAFAGLLFLMRFVQKSGLSDTFLGSGLHMILSQLLYVAVLVFVGLVGAR
eukprot:SAG31_NODE_835_length_11646_cov_11.142201_8_plen_1125_part_00